MLRMKPIVIHDIKRTDRYDTLEKEFTDQGIFDFHIVPAVFDRGKPVANITEAHKRCIRLAKEQGYDRALIVEDDVKFMAPGAFDRFIELSSELPDDWVIYCAGVYDGRMNMVTEHLAKTPNISGLHCYMVRDTFFDTVLSSPGKINLDKWMTGKRYANAEAHVAYPMLALQYDGYSDNVQKETNYLPKTLSRYKVWEGK